MTDAESAIGASMFPGLGPASASPTVSDMDEARRRALFSRDVQLVGYHTRIFDMGDRRQLSEYDKTMKDLLLASRRMEAVISVHSRDKLQRKDGSTGWFNYVEWAEYKLNEKPVQAVAPAIGG